MSCPRLIAICYLTFLLSMADHALAQASTVEMPRSYCGISSMYGAVSAIYKAAGKPPPCTFADLISEKFVSSSKGSTNADLEGVASFCHLKAETISSRGWNTLANATGPLVLHTYPRGAPGKFSHWLLFLGIEDSNAIVIDGEGGKTLLTKSDLLSRWDGIAIVVHSLDFAPVNSISVEIVPILGAISLVGGLILLVSYVVQIRRVGNSIYGNMVAFWTIIGGTYLIFFVVNGSTAVAPAIANGIAIELGVAKVATISAEEVRATIEAGTSTLIDCRYVRDSTKRRLPNALCMPVNCSLSKIHRETDSWPRSTKLVFYCQSEGCGFADAMCSEFVRMGFNDVRIFREGVVGWENAKYEFEI